MTFYPAFRALFLWFLLLVLPLSSFAQQPNGILDSEAELVTRKEYFVPMPDSALLATDVFVPILSDDLAFQNLMVDVGPFLGLGSPLPVTVPRLQLAGRGTQLMQYPNQANPRQLPMLFTRTPYNKQDPTQGTLEALMGYAGVVQDMRGRYNSSGTYYPMYSDGWDKRPYYGDSLGYMLDTTTNKLANRHEDGWNSLTWLRDSLRWDRNGDGQLTAADSLLSNGLQGMFGASALGNSQFQAAAAHRIDPNQPGLKAMMPIVASADHYATTGHPNGVFREQIIEGWLRSQVEAGNIYDSGPDSSLLNFVHSLDDYGPQVNSPAEAAEAAIDAWSKALDAHYPDARFRSSMDFTAAPVDAAGEGDSNGTHSRYENLQLPTYNLTGWWDIFTDGQILAWAKTRRNTGAAFKTKQQLVIGPWAHQTIGTRETGDALASDHAGRDTRYPANVSELLDMNLSSDLNNLGVDEIAKIADSEIIKWFRSFLGGEPSVILPSQNFWQYAAGPMPPTLPDSVFVKVPAQDYQTTHVEFFNYLIGADTLRDFPVSVKGLAGTDSNQVQLVDLPPMSGGLVGGGSNKPIPPAQAVNWDSVPAVRFYVPGPTGTADSSLGNYWFEADTFPLPEPIISRQKLYLHAADSSLSANAPAGPEGSLSYAHDPDNPVDTYGGNNMIVKVPGGGRNSQGQMDYANPAALPFTLNRPDISVGGQNYPDVLSFTSEAVEDSFSVAGIPVMKLYASSAPQGGPQDSTSTDFVVRVLDVYPDGREYFVFSGAVNARARAYTAKWAQTGEEDPSVPFRNIVPDSTYEYTFRTLPIAYTWGPGHKMKLLVSSASYPRYQSNPNLPLEPREFFRRRPGDGQTYDYFGQQLAPRKAVQTLSISDVHAAHIDLPVLGKPFGLDTTGRPAAAADQVQSLAARAFPNPSRGQVTLRLNLLGEYRLSLRNTLGQEVFATRFSGRQTHLALGDLPPGLYTLQAVRADGTAAPPLKLLLQ